jgi:ferredoxin
MNDYRACTGCGICVLPCPVWQETRDLSLTLAGRALALQGGATAVDLRESLEACVTCGACEPVCPEEIDTVGMTLDLRRSVPLDLPELDRRNGQKGSFLPGDSLRRHRLHDVVLQRLGVSSVDGSDISAGIEAGRPVSPDRQREFLDCLVGTELIVDDGILHRPLRSWGFDVIGLGEALLRKSPELRATDLYVIETRGYHSDFQRLVRFYDELRQRVGCEMNLDLQRAAIATGAASLQGRTGKGGIDAAGQARWILEGRVVERIVVECVDDMEPFQEITDLPVVHLAEVTP